MRMNRLLRANRRAVLQTVVMVDTATTATTVLALPLCKRLLGLCLVLLLLALLQFYNNPKFAAVK